MFITEDTEVLHVNDFLHSSGFREEIRYSGTIVSVADNKMERQKQMVFDSSLHQNVCKCGTVHNVQDPVLHYAIQSLCMLRDLFFFVLVLMF